MNEPSEIEKQAESKEPLCRRTTFFVNVDWRMGATLATATNIVGQMYVECLEPVNRLYPYPIVLIHGDFHTGQTTKPDGEPGWASFFLRKGFQVLIVDLPPSGRSNFLTTSHYLHRDVGVTSSSLKAQAVETTLTAPGKRRAPHIPLQYEKATLHNKWPGTGQRGDPIFAKYCASLVTLHLNKVERQSLAQNALQALLRHVGKSILIGEGSGGNMTWLAADVEPDLVAGVMAVEPVGPPFGTACPKGANPYREYSPFIERQEGMRIYGLADIPITYDPPTHPHEGFDPPAKDPLDLIKVVAPDGKSECYMQRSADGKVNNKVRQLINLKKIPNFVLTAHASSHAMYDWATVAFLMQAGVTPEWAKLDEMGIEGNGHLMFLETNSDEIAQVLLGWIQREVLPKSFSETMDKVTVPEQDSVAEMIEQAQKKDSPPVVACNLQLASEPEKCPNTQPMDNKPSEAPALATPQLLSPELTESRPIEGPHKRARLDIPTTASAQPSTPSTIHLPIQKPLEKQQQRVQQTSTAPRQQHMASPMGHNIPGLSLMGSNHPTGGPSRLLQQANRSIRSPLVNPSFGLTGFGQAYDPFCDRPNDQTDELPFSHRLSSAHRENQRSYAHNNTHTTARFERSIGTAEESIAAMTMGHPSRFASGLEYTPSMTSQVHRPIMSHSPQQIPYLGQLGHTPPVSFTGEFKPIPTSTPIERPTSMMGNALPFTPLESLAGFGSRGQNQFGGLPQMTPPSPSPAPRQSLNPLSYNLDTDLPVLSQPQQKSSPK
ncbi:hypothetical protein NW766_006880 [Fusarium irregulare]|uniref:AB hydrolase-1 domain-containing protein n=1 Tax=Fusarium irregulare TaxID=2494466 RepID=A0A9W8PNN5_9HYPO|nr:hypothetical protein NW766_006880 [Fusarium irregulare]